MQFNRRILISISMFLTLAVLNASNVMAATKSETFQEIADHFIQVPSMAGEFVQFDSRGQQSGGKFYLQRPGKIRFNYDDPTPIKVISNGKTVAVNNRKLDTWDFYPLNKTPLALLLGKEMKFDAKSVHDVRRDKDLTTIVMGDQKVFGKSLITMMFDPRTKDLRQWVIKDAQGKETTVMIFNVQKNIKIPPAFFTVNQLKIQRRLQNIDR